MTLSQNHCNYLVQGNSLKLDKIQCAASKHFWGPQERQRSSQSPGRSISRGNSSISTFSLLCKLFQVTYIAPVPPQTIVACIRVDYCKSMPQGAGAGRRREKIPHEQKNPLANRRSGRENTIPMEYSRCCRACTPQTGKSVVPDLYFSNPKMSDPDFPRSKKNQDQVSIS